MSKADGFLRTVLVHVPVPDAQKLGVLAVRRVGVVDRLPVSLQLVELQVVEVGVGCGSNRSLSPPSFLLRERRVQYNEVVIAHMAGYPAGMLC